MILKAVILSFNNCFLSQAREKFSRQQSYHKGHHAAWQEHQQKHNRLHDRRHKARNTPAETVCLRKHPDKVNLSAPQLGNTCSQEQQEKIVRNCFVFT